MPYATPPQYLSDFGIDEALQLLRDEERLLTKQLLLDAIAGTWTGTPSAEEQAAGTAALARLTAKLEATSSYMDGYLRAAVTLPVDAGASYYSNLRDCCLALTRYALADDAENATDRMDAIAKQWREWLRDVSARRVSLTADDGSVAATGGGVLYGQAKSAYDWCRFGAVR